MTYPSRTSFTAPGKSIDIPGLTVGNIVTESLFDSEAIQKVIERMTEVRKEFRKIEYGSKMKECFQTGLH